MKKVSFKYFPIVTLAVLAITISSCGGKKPVSEGHKHFDKKEYSQAAKIYSEAYGDQPKAMKGEVAFKAGEAFRKYNNYKSAEKWYAKAEKDKYGLEATKRRAEMLKAMEKYEEAIIAYNDYLKENPNDEEAKKGKECAEMSLRWKGEKSRYIVENVKKINSTNNDYGPAMVKKEALIFTSDRPEGVNKKGVFQWTGVGYSDQYQVALNKKNGAITGAPSLLAGQINTDWNDGASVVDDKGNTIYFTQCGGLEKGGRIQTCQIYTSSKRGKDWDVPTMLPFCDTTYNYGQVAISADGKQLFFSSDMPGGYGGHDIYVVNISKRANSWGDPINLGTTINTTRDEMFPSVSKNGALYFASSGHCGMGGLDIFRSEGAGNEWSTPENLKSPINSGGDDFAVALKDETEEKGYFSSNRAGGRGGDDIYEFYMTPLIFTLSGIARDCITKQPIKNTEIFISNDRDTNKLRIVTDNNGYYKIILQKETNYDLFGDKNLDFYNPSPKYYQTTKLLKKSTDLVQDLDLCRLDLEGMFNVRGILYDLDKANIRPDAAKILDDSVITLMKRFPTIVIELGSHTDCRASHEYNRDLAQRRADSAVAYIVSRGIDSARLIAKGYGEDMLEIKKCKCDLSDVHNICTEAEHQLNRRTTVRVLRTDYFSADEQKKREQRQKDIDAQVQKQEQERLKKEEDLKKTPQQKIEEDKKMSADDKRKQREEDLKKRQKEMEDKRKQREADMKKRQEEMKQKQEQRKKELEEQRKNRQPKTNGG